MSHHVLQFHSNSAFHAALDYHEQRSQQRAAQRARALPVPLLLTHAQQSDHGQQQQHAACRSDKSAFRYDAAAWSCDFTFTDVWDSSRIRALLLDESEQQDLQSNLQPSKFGQQPSGHPVASDADVVQLLLGASLDVQLQRVRCMEPFVFPPTQCKVTAACVDIACSRS